MTTTALIERSRWAAALVGVIVSAGVAAMFAQSASANVSYSDGGTTQVEVACQASLAYGHVSTRSTTSVAWGSPHYRVWVYNGSQLMLQSGWIPSGSGAVLYSSPTLRYRATHFWVQHARIINGRWNYTNPVWLDYFVEINGRVDDCFF